MADPLSVVGFVTSLLSIASCAYTITFVTREWSRRLEFSKELSGVHQHEIEVLQKVIDECRDIARSATVVPGSIEDSFDNCATREKDLLKLLERQAGTRSKWSEMIRLSLLNKDIQRRYNMFRESVVLLRGLCSEYASLFLHHR